MLAAEDLFIRIKNKEVEITLKSFNEVSRKTFDGKVISFFRLGTDFFIGFEDGRVINIRYIESLIVIK